MWIKYLLDFFLEIIKMWSLGRFKHHLSTETARNADEREEKQIQILPWQNSPELLSQVQKWGCYFLSIVYISLYFKSKYKREKKILDASEINLIFKGLSEKHILKKNCFVRDPNGILKELGIFDLIEFVGEKEDFTLLKKKKVGKNCINIIQYDHNDLSHFVVGDWSGKILFDSLGDSFVRLNGKPVSIRRFVLKKKIEA